MPESGDITLSGLLFLRWGHFVVQVGLSLMKDLPQSPRSRITAHATANNFIYLMTNASKCKNQTSGA